MPHVTAHTGVVDVTNQVVATDNCSAVTLSQSPAAGTLIGPGPTVIQVQGPVPVSTQSSTYPLRQPEAMIAAALAAQPASAQSVGTTVPKVALSRATLVYIAVRPGYYEPALLFTGSFTIGNQIYEKRVLVPAIDPSRLQP